MTRWLVLAAAAVLASAPAAVKPAPGLVRVRFDTSAGSFELALEAKRAPATTRNFLAYVDDGRFDGASVYRVARNRTVPTHGFIQGGIRTDARRILPPFPLETTAMTGLRHVDGTISMARRAGPDSAGGNFFITVGAIPSMDARAGSPGYAAFGHVVAGMPLIRRILAQPTGARMNGTMLARQIMIVRARRVDGTANPTGRVKPWLIDTGH